MDALGLKHMVVWHLEKQLETFLAIKAGIKEPGCIKDKLVEIQTDCQEQLKELDTRSDQAPAARCLTLWCHLRIGDLHSSSSL